MLSSSYNMHFRFFFHVESGLYVSQPTMDVGQPTMELGEALCMQNTPCQ